MEDEYLFGKPTRLYENADGGFANKIYKDSKGIPTIGIGHKLTPTELNSGLYNNGIDREGAITLFNKDKDAATNKFYENNPKYITYPKSVRNGLNDVAFNMGPNFLEKFPAMKNKLDSEDFVGAATELLAGSKPGTDSQYLKDVGQRANDNAMRIAIGNQVMDSYRRMNTNDNAIADTKYPAKSGLGGSKLAINTSSEAFTPLSFNGSFHFKDNNKEDNNYKNKRKL